MSILFFALGLGLVGMLGSSLLFGLNDPDHQPASFTRISGWMLTVLFATLAVNWGLSGFRALAPVPLLLAPWGLALALMGTRARRSLRCGWGEWGTSGWFRLRGPRAFPLGLALPLLVAFGLWVAFLLWKGWLLPVASHDALAYHFPKAAFLKLAHGYAFIPCNDARIAANPANYEFILADFLILTGADRMTAWVSTFCYLLFLVQAMQMVEAWWGKGLKVWAMGLFCAGLPVALLHAGAHKNDLLMINFIMGAFFWGTQWALRRQPGDLLWCILCWLAGLGTKLSGILFIPALLIPLVFAWWTSPSRRLGLRRREAWCLGLGLPLGFLLLGGMAYLLNFLAVGDLLGGTAAGVSQDMGHNIGAGYGQWSAVWMFPVLLLLVPFSGSASLVWVPWRGESWFWPKHEIFFSHFGGLFTILALSIPIVLFLNRKRLRLAWPVEARLASATMLACALAVIPVKYSTLGLFAWYPRYLMFLPVLVAFGSLVPLLAWAERNPLHGRAVGLAVLSVLGLVFVWEAGDAALNDAFTPYAYVEYAAAHPGTREVFFLHYRACQVLDRIAGPRDVVAIDGGEDSWIYPAFGRGLGRKVILLDDRKDFRTAIADADWVAVDRSWAIIWGNPALTDMGKLGRYLGTGRPLPQDTKVLEALLQDPKWELVYRFAARNQALFRRKVTGMGANRNTVN
jgi:hypothetical protein